MQYLGGLQQKGSIKSFDTVFLNPHGGDLNGFILIRAESGQLDALMSSADWVRHMTRRASSRPRGRNTWGHRRHDNGEDESLDFVDSVIAWAPVAPIAEAAAKQKT
jgi:hypothetical protein